MNGKKAKQILNETSYVRFSGTKEEKLCAEYLSGLCKEMNLEAYLEPFPVKIYQTLEEKLFIDGKEIPCTAFWGAGTGKVEGKLYYLSSADPVSLKKCKDKIVLTDLALGHKLYDQLISSGAKGFITYSGLLSDSNREINIREICYQTPEESRIPAVNIHIADAFEAVKNESKTAQITLKQSCSLGESYNVILDLDGETEETIVISAHYDSTQFSLGAYDNMSSCIALLHLAQYFSKHPCRRRIRLLWCGSEERGLLGSLAYCRMHENLKKQTVLNINLDMLGSVMGEFVAFSCMNEEMKDFLQRFFAKKRISGSVRYGIRSSDSNSFLHHKIPAISFARYAPGGLVKIHTPSDTKKAVSPKQILADSKIVLKFTEYMANALEFPVPMTISEKIQKDVEAYMERKPK